MVHEQSPCTHTSFAHAVALFQLELVSDGMSKSQVANHLKHMVAVKSCVSLVLQCHIWLWATLGELSMYSFTHMIHTDNYAVHTFGHSYLCFEGMLSTAGLITSHVYTHASVHAPTRTQPCTRKHTHMYTHAHTCTHAHTRTLPMHNTHTHTSTRTHTHHHHQNHHLGFSTVQTLVKP